MGDYGLKETTPTTLNVVCVGVIAGGKTHVTKKLAESLPKKHGLSAYLVEEPIAEWTEELPVGGGDTKPRSVLDWYYEDMPARAGMFQQMAWQLRLGKYAKIPSTTTVRLFDSHTLFDYVFLNAQKELKAPSESLGGEVVPIMTDTTAAVYHLTWKHSRELAPHADPDLVLYLHHPEDHLVERDPNLKDSPLVKTCLERVASRAEKHPERAKERDTVTYEYLEMLKKHYELYIFGTGSDSMKVKAKGIWNENPKIVTLDVSKPKEEVVLDAESAIVEALAEKVLEGK